MEPLARPHAIRLGVVATLLSVLLWITFGLKFNHVSTSRLLEVYTDYTMKAEEEGIIPALRDKCASVEWIEGLYFKCDWIPGGVGNVIHMHLACIRYAIEAGASITLPMIMRRGEDDLTSLENGHYESFDYFFDSEWFKASMAINCPQMTILDGLSDLDDFVTAHVPDLLHPIDLHEHSGPIDTNWRIFQSSLLAWLGYRPSLHVPAVVRLRLLLFEWDAHDATQEFFATFGKIMRFRPDVTALAAKVKQRLQADGKQAFLGAHLRTEGDVKDIWVPYEVQKDSFLQTVKAKSLSRIFVASGDLDDVARLKAEASENNVQVYSKAELLDAADLKALHELSWDQQGLVDYLVLRDATYFIGSSPSSFSYAIAYARHNDISPETVFPFPEDELSRIEGEQIEVFRYGMWPI